MNAARRKHTSFLDKSSFQNFWSSGNQDYFWTFFNPLWMGDMQVKCCTNLLSN